MKRKGFVGEVKCKAFQASGLSVAKEDSKESGCCVLCFHLHFSGSNKHVLHTRT